MVGNDSPGLPPCSHSSELCLTTSLRLSFWFYIGFICVVPTMFDQLLYMVTSARFRAQNCIGSPPRDQCCLTTQISLLLFFGKGRETFKQDFVVFFAKGRETFKQTIRG